MKRVIINADDFGWSSAVNGGVIKAHADGILTSTTLLMNGPALEEAVELAGAHLTLGVGVHMNIVRGKPLSDPTKIPSLVDGNGRFPGSAEHILMRMMLGRVSKEEIGIEIGAQISAFKDRLGMPTHVDSEKHMHAFAPFSAAAVTVARENDISAMRCPKETLGGSGAALMQRFKSWLLVRSADRLRRLAGQAGITTPATFVGIGDTGRMTGERYRNIFDATDSGVTEIMTHPGYFNDSEHTDFRSGFIKHTREIELQGLLEPGLKEYAGERGITLVHFGDL